MLLCRGHDARSSIAQIHTKMLNRPTDRFVVTDSSGHGPRLMDVQEILELRATGQRFYLEGYSDACATTEMTAAALVPPQSVIDLRYYIYDHLGNTRVVYKTDVTSCTAQTYALEFAADYSPYGRLLRSFTVAGGRERYLTTGHERDQETGYDNRGARLYDAEIGRFLTVDPLAQKFANWSTYNYVLGNPVKLVDPDGKEPTDNIIYLLALKGSDTKMVSDAGVKLQEYLKVAGLKTQVCIVNDPDKFEIGKIDRTDAVAVIGSTKKQSCDYILDNCSGYTSKKYQTVLKTKGIDKYRDSPMYYNPENSDDGEGKWGYVISTSTFMNQGGINAPNHCNLKSADEFLGLILLHGMGHLAGIGHPDVNSLDRGYMQEGQYLASDFKNIDNGDVSSMIKRTVNNYKATMTKISSRFSTEAKLNYDPNNK